MDYMDKLQICSLLLVPFDIYIKVINTNVTHRQYLLKSLVIVTCTKVTGLQYVNCI
jgi:hypothetical protein